MSQTAETSESVATSTDLRTALERMRQEAEREIARLNQKLEDRQHEAETRQVSATEGIALQQELTTLRQTLGQKEHALDRITQECRRLEDKLEDQHVVFDGLKQEVERKESSLKAAREEVLRLQQQLEAIQERPALRSGSSDAAVSGPRDEPTGEPRVTSWVRARATLSLKGFVLGVLSAAAVLGVAGLWVSRDEGRPWTREGHTESTALPPLEVESTKAETQSSSEAADTVARADKQSNTEPAVQPGIPDQPPPTQRDRLSGGAFGPALSILPGGTFRMGRNTLAGGDTGPEHLVRIGAFGLGQKEVTFDQYDLFARATGRRRPNDFGWGRGDRPVVGVSWSDAQAYVSWLSRQTGRHYRLPSEAEWEYAARGGGRGSYWWGFGLEPGRATCFDCGSPWDNKSTAPVGSFSPSAYGLHDTAGNVMEWVGDCYHPSYEDAPTDGQVRVDGDCRLRVARGGAFNKPSASMRAYVRTKLDPEARLNNLGFRVARDPE